MERTKETLEARVRETPLADRLKECRQRIGKMCSEGRPPRMCIPVQHDDDDFFICTTLADAQATVEALQAQLEAAERHNTILQDANKVALEKVEALQRERDEVSRKYHEAMDIMSAWKNIDHAEAVARLLEANKALDAEREKVKGLHEITKVICTHCCEPMEIPSKAVLQTQLTQLQALVRALQVVRIDLNGAYHDTLLARPEDDAVKELLEYRATLDATTPAKEQVKHEK